MTQIQLLPGEMDEKERKRRRVSCGLGEGETREDNGEETDGGMTPVLIGVLMDTAVTACVVLFWGAYTYGVQRVH